MFDLEDDQDYQGGPGARRLRGISGPSDARVAQARSAVDIAGPGTNRPAVDLPGIEVPKKSSTQQSAVSTQPSTSMAGANSAKSANSTNPDNSIISPKASIAAPTQLSTDQQKLADLKAKGSPISRIHNPFLRGLAHVGDIAGTAFLPGYADLPFTDLKYRSNVRQAEHAVNQDLGEQKTEADIEHQQAETQHLNNPGTVKDEQLLYDKNGSPIGYRDDQGKYYSPDDLAKATDPNLQAVSRVLQNAQTKQAAPKEGELPLGERVSQLNEILSNRYQVLNPGHELPAPYVLPQNATQKDYDRIDKALEAEERARGTKAQQDTANALRQQAMALAKANAGDRASARSDKNYDRREGELGKLGDPVKQAIQRLGRLQDTLRQGTPQADALVAPELLTVMAGGAGSGLRMNEAEISRVVGGRSHWEDLKASANKWSTDPQTANSITPEQRIQIRRLVNEVQNKLLAKQRVLDDADAKLLDTDDVAEQRRIVSDAKHTLTMIDEGQMPGQTIHYVDGNDQYDIPPEKEAAFLTKHPNAKKGGTQ